MEEVIPSVDSVTRFVEMLIEKGELEPGDRLPGEHEMSRSLSVSRAVVREALNGLKARGIIVVVPGKGSFVTKQLPRSVQDFHLFGNVSNAEISETRWHLESINSSLAAIRRTDEDLKRLESVLRESQQSTNPDEWVRLDSEFHVLLAEATHNKILARLSQDIKGLQFEQSRRVSYQPGQIEAANREHEDLLVAIRDGDPTRSVEMIRRHLSRIQEKSAINLTPEEQGECE